MKAARQRLLALQYLFGVAQEILAVFGQGQLARGPIQKGSADLLFEPPDLMTDGGLGQMEPLRRTGESAGFANGNKGAKQCGLKVHGSHI